MLPQTLSRNITMDGGCKMYVKKLYIAVWALNFALVGMVGYVWGQHDGIQIGRTALHTVDPVAIEYALYQAMQND